MELSCTNRQTCQTQQTRNPITEKSQEEDQKDHFDIAVPNDVNIARKKRTEKMDNYANLAIEIKQLWHAQTVKIFPIIIGATD